MHICFLCNEYPPGPHGGVGSFTQTVGRALAGRGHQVTVVGVYLGGEADEENDQGVRVLRLPHTRLPGAGFLVNGHRVRTALRHLHRQSPIDVLEGPELSLAVVPHGFPAAKVIRMHGGHHFFSVTLGVKPRPWRSWLERRSFGRADYLCAVSRFAAETTRKLLKLGITPIEILPNPIDTEAFAPRPQVAEEAGLIAFVGTVCEKKGIRQLVEAMPRVVGEVPTARLWVCGRDWRDPKTGTSYTAGLRSTISAEFAARVEFRGPVENAVLPEILSRAAVCVYPSHMETQGIVVNEGMAMGRAVLASRTGPGPELIEDGVHGLLCDPHSPADIAEKLIRLLKDPALRRRLGTAARERAVHEFSVDALVTKNEEFYRRCVEQHHKAIHV